MARALGVLLAVLVLVGCAPTSASGGVWRQPGVSRQRQVRDEYECERQAVLSDRRAGAQAALFAACMKARGYVPATTEELGGHAPGNRR
jgi:hypothetical protein